LLDYQTDALTLACGIEMVEMNKGDIERSPIVSKILEIYNQGDNHKPLDQSNPKPVDSAKDDMDAFWETVDNSNKNLSSDAALIPIQHISKRPSI
jgi:hypothetical protein